jgi:hypothetical protein
MISPRTFCFVPAVGGRQRPSFPRHKVIFKVLWVRPVQLRLPFTFEKRKKFTGARFLENEAEWKDIDFTWTVLFSAIDKNSGVYVNRGIVPVQKAVSRRRDSTFPIQLQCCGAETICLGSSSGSDFQKVSTPVPALA